jgi:nucleotide-binding universal stress UspA family protein
MKKVLIALDYDPTAQKVAETGYALTKAMHAEVVLMHVISQALHYSLIEYPVMGFGGYMNIDPKQLDLVDKQLKQTSMDFLEQTKNHLFDKSITIQISEGDAAEAILDMAKTISADVIVIGSHSRKWLEKIVMGSVAEKVLRHTSIPLFIVPTKKIDSLL